LRDFPPCLLTRHGPAWNKYSRIKVNGEVRA
jgi:hypothetical protein